MNNKQKVKVLVNPLPVKHPTVSPTIITYVSCKQLCSTNFVQAFLVYMS